MKLKKLLRFIPDVSTTRVIRESRGLYGQTYKVMFEGQCEKSRTGLWILRLWQ